MIAYLNGTLIEKRQETAVIDVNGVGYEVWVSTQTHQQLPKEQESIHLITYHHYTDSEQRLFGFYTTDEKQLFEQLITVKNIGPKLGLSILSGYPADQIRRAIAQHDNKTLSSISGIGKKTAERIVLELKDKMQDVTTLTAEEGAEMIEDERREEAVSALESLGYRKSNAEKAIQKVLKHNSDGEVDNLVKAALKQIGS
jgi:Holliday junction DNA helicase RuvA